LDELEIESINKKAGIAKRIITREEKVEIQ
jgi:hypothetical protein